MKELIRKLTVLFLLFFLFSACAKQESTSGKPQSIRIAVPYEIEGLDPHSKAWLSQYAITGNFYEPLVGADENSKIEPRLASSWENPDASTWIFHLQPNVRFHNGKKFQADDVVFTMNRLLDKKLAVSSYLTDVVEVTAVDPLTVRVRTRTPLAIFLNKMNNVLIVPEDSSGEFGNNVNGTGPYRLEEFRRGESIRLIRNEDYWGTKPALLARRTGCGLLLDVNNVQVSCINHGGDPRAYLERFPVRHVGEVHLAGHAQADGAEDALLIDSHDRPVAEAVWGLYADLIAAAGPLPTMIEWDNDVPEWPVLHAEVRRAQGVLDAASDAAGGRRHVA